MEVGLAVIVVIGFLRGNVSIVVNAGVGLAVTQLVPVLERNYEVPMDPALTLWITSAVFFHALGTLSFPGSPVNIYRSLWWWDHFTHALSSSIVAAVGYATVRAFDRHSEAIYIPTRLTFVFVLQFVLAFGVLWEVLEFGLGLVFGSATVLTQYGLSDTLLDLVFDTIGAVVAAVWGTAHLGDVVGWAADGLERRQS